MINKKLFHQLFSTIISVLFTTVISINAQGIPTDYQLESVLKKTSDKTPAANTVDRILVQDKSTIWIGTSKGLSKTADGGTSWTNYYKSNDFGTESISAINYGLGAIWAGCWHYENKLGSDVATGSGLRYSLDGGNNWTTIAQPVDDPGDSSIVYGINKLRALPVTATQQNFIYDIAFTNNTIWIVSFSGGLRKSTDMGKTWQRVVLPPDSLDSIKPTEKLDFDLAPSSGNLKMRGNLNHRAFSIVAIEDTLYVGTAGGINKSVDGGISWVKYNHTNQTQPISGNFVLALDYNPINGSVWASTWKAEGANEFYGVSYTRDKGNTWEVVLTDERVRDFGFKYKTSSNPDVFAAAADGIYRSADNGISWVAAPKIIDETSKIEVKPTLYLSVETNRLNSGSSEIWIGTNDGLAKTLETETESWNNVWKVFLASSGSTNVNESFAFPNPFNPKNDVVRIKYNLTKSSSVTLRIMDFGMNLVKTVLQNASRGENSEQIDFWDGKDENGKVVPNGVYFYRLDIDGSDPLFGKIIVMM